MKLYIAKDSDGNVVLFQKKPRKWYRGSEDYFFEPDKGGWVEIPKLECGDCKSLNLKIVI